MKKIVFFILVLAALGFFAVPVNADKPSGVGHTNSWWVGPRTDDPSTTIGNGDLYISNDLVFGDSGAISGTVDLSGATLTMPGPRTISFPLGAAMVDGTGPILSSTAPNLTTLDNIPAILYDNSSEVAPVQWTFLVPDDYSTGMTFYLIVSSNDASGSGTKVDWAITRNRDDTSFASPTAQALVECTSATLDASNEVLTFTPDATGAALFTSGSWITIEFFNASTNDDDLEIKGVVGKYTPAY